MFDPSLFFQSPVIAHRGARAHAPENTMAAFKAARDQGALWIETNVKLTSDGMPILFHDDRLERTTNGQGSVADTTWEDMRHLDAGSWFSPDFAGASVPALADLVTFAHAGGLRLNLELRPCPGRTQATTMVALIEAAKLWPENASPPLISSFDIDALVIAARLHPGWPRGILMDEWRDDWRELMTKTQAITLNINAVLLTPDRTRMLHETGVALLAYNVNDPAQAKLLVQNGVRAVFSDDPGTFLRAI